MIELGDGEADLILTSPPYFPPSTEPALRLPVAQQGDFDRIEREVVEFAVRLRPVFAEMRRVLRPSGVLVLQTKDLRYAGFLIALSDIHAELALGAGFRLLTRLFWLPQHITPRRLPPFVRRPLRGTFRALEPEVFAVFSGPEPPHRGAPLTLGSRSALDLASPLWRTGTRRRADDHPFASPRLVVRQLIDLYSEPGDLVVDPFAGHGTTLVEARDLDRKSIGWDIDPHCVAESARRLE